VKQPIKKAIKPSLLTLTLTSILMLGVVTQAQVQGASGDPPNIVAEIVVSNSNVDVGEQFVFKDYSLQISGLTVPRVGNLLSFQNLTGLDTNGADNSSQQALQEFGNNISTKSH